MKKLLNEWRKYITEGKCGNSWCESDKECVDGECVDKQPEPPEEEEELTKVLSETEQVLGDKLGQIVNAWGGYKLAGDLKGLIKVLKSWDVPKPAAIQIIKAKTQEEVVSIVKSL
jgi:hypothetical protein